MFGFFTDIKNRLVALEQKLEVIWNHLFAPAPAEAAKEEAAPAAAAPEVKNDAVENKEAS